MVYRRSGKKRSYKPRASAMRGRRVRRSIYSSNNVRTGPNTCKVVETLTVPINLNTPYIFSKAGITGVRAPLIAPTFGLYRIASLKFTLRPILDTYIPGNAGAGNAPVTVPTFYWKMNRYGDAPPAFDDNYLRALGAKAYRLDDKQVTFGYKPNMLLVGQDAAGVNSAQVKITPWLSTDEAPADGVFNISTAEHYGHLMFTTAAGAGNAQGLVANMDVQIVYEFKNPRSPAIPQPGQVGGAPLRM